MAEPGRRGGRRAAPPGEGSPGVPASTPQGMEPLAGDRQKRLRVATPSDLAGFVGVDIASPEMAVSQDDVDRFVALSGDPQWIHLAPPHAASGRLAATPLVPGNLLLSQLPRLLQQSYAVERFDRSLTAGYRQVRFRAPVAPGSSIRLLASFLSVTPARDFVRVETACRIEIVASRRIAMTATVTDLFYP